MRQPNEGMLTSYSAGFLPSDVYPMTIQVMEEAGVLMVWACSKGVAKFLEKSQSATRLLTVPKQKGTANQFGRFVVICLH